MNDHKHWLERARHLAGRSHEVDFATRRAIEGLPGTRVVCYSNNNPYKRSQSLRDLETNLFRAEFAKLGHREVAYAEYPPVGTEEGYSFALLIEIAAGSGKKQALAELRAMLDEVLQLTDRMLRDLP